MNVSADLLVQLARASGAPMDSRAEGVVRWATDKLKERSPINEWWVEVFEAGMSKWDFHSFHTTRAAAAEAKAKLEQNYGAKYRVVEISRRVLP